MPITHPLALARLPQVTASLDLTGDPDYDYAAHPLAVGRVLSSYFAEWDFDIPARGVGYFDDTELDPSTD